MFSTTLLTDRQINKQTKTNAYPPYADINHNTTLYSLTTVTELL